MNRILLLVCALALSALAVAAQPRPVETSGKPTVVPAAVAPTTQSSFAAKYEGGMFGYSSKEVGTLRLDDENQRIVFFGKDQKEKFGIPYKSVQVIYPQSKSVTSTAGQVVRNIPLPGSMLGGLIKEKRRYMVLHFNDPDVDARGLANFKIENKELLDSLIMTLATKANLTQRGDAYYRPKKNKDEI
jgi:hypothetical protein